MAGLPAGAGEFAVAGPGNRRARDIVGFAFFLLMVGAPVSALWAQAAPPNEFGGVWAWTPRGAWVPNPAETPSLVAEADATHFSIAEPNRGMKWAADVKTFAPADSGFLVLRYRAENLGDADYFIWVFDGSKEGRRLVPRQAVRDDGQWHVLAVDLSAAGVTGRIRGLAVAVMASSKVPASLRLGPIRHVQEAPSGAERYPKEAPPAFEWAEDFHAPADWKPQPAWLANPDSGAGLAVEAGAAVMTVPAAGKGMKWSRAYKDRVALGDARYVAVRYRAQHLARQGDYFVWIGGQGRDKASAQSVLMPLTEVEDDGAWHVYVAPLREQFDMAEMALQAQASAAVGRAWIDYVKFTNRRPLAPLRDVLAWTQGHGGSRLRSGDAVAVDLSESANAAIGPRLHELGLANWFDGGEVTVEGIPFTLGAGGAKVVETPRGKVEPVWVPIGKKAREAYLLVASILPQEDFTGMEGGRPFSRFSDPERFVVRVRYRDGLEDLHFPVRVRTGQYEMVRGVDVYALPDLRPAPMEQMALECRMPSGCIVLAAATLNTGRPVTAKPQAGFLPPPVPERAVEPHKARIEIQGTVLTVEAGMLAAVFETRKGLVLASLRHDGLASQGRSAARWPATSIFELGAGETVLKSDEVTVSGLRREGGAAVMDVDARPRVPLAGTLRLTGSDAGEIVMALDLKNVSDRPVRPVVNFPAFSHVGLGDAENTWYFFPRQSAVIGNVPAVLREPYSGRFPLQVTGLFNPSLGGGIYMLIHDLDDIYKYYVIDKNAQGVDWRVEYFAREYLPGERIEVAEAALGGHAGDWRAQLAAYGRWANAWYRPAAPRKDWFRDVYVYRQHYVRSDLYDSRKKEYRMMEVVETDRRRLGRIDYLHIFDFGQSDTYGRVGDYSHYDEIGGLEKLAAAIAGVKASGVPVGLYIEGYLCDERGVWGRGHVAGGHIIQKDGKPLLWPGAPMEHMMCAAWAPWQEHLAGVYARVAGELKPSGMYIDQHGFANEWKICWSRAHGHPAPWAPLRGERDLGLRIRRAVPPGIATLTEETPTDLNSQGQDGALGYSVAFADARLAPHRVDLFRFAFPDFKVLQLVTYNEFVDGGWALLKFPFFNGEGWWLAQAADGGFEPAAQAFLQRASDILHEHREAFRSLSPRPLVPTEGPLLYANEFAGAKETVWTLFNADYRTYRGPALAIRHVEAATYRDRWKGVALAPQVSGGRAVVALEIGPREVGCVVQTRP